MSDNVAPAPELARLEDEAAPMTERTIRFDDPDPNTHHVVIYVKEQKFYCIKMVLAKHSQYFYDLFFKDTVCIGKQEINLEEATNAPEFNTFLRILNGLSDLNDDKVSGVMKMAVQWECKVALQGCVNFLKTSSELTAEQKFDLAQQYDLMDLKKAIISECKSCDVLHKIIPKDVMDLDHKTMGLIFERNLVLQGLQRGNVPENSPPPIRRMPPGAEGSISDDEVFAARVAAIRRDLDNFRE